MSNRYNIKSNRPEVQAIESDLVLGNVEIVGEFSVPFEGASAISYVSLEFDGEIGKIPVILNGVLQGYIPLLTEGGE